MEQNTLMVVIAHPDDESFPIGGTLAKYSAEGARIVLVSATHGEAGIPGLSPSETAKLREAELKSAAQVLGISRVIFLDYVDGKLDQVDERTAVAALKKIIQKEKPNALITFGADGISGHPDHVAIHRLTTEAFDQSDINNRLFYILPSEATQEGCGVTPSQEFLVGPVVGIDISNFRLAKVQAVQCHTSQNRPFTGDPEKEAKGLTCHEYFILARPKKIEIEPTNLFD